MLGLEGTGVFLAYILCILSALMCVVYGMMNWNKPAADDSKEINEELEWEKKDADIMQ